MRCSPRDAHERSTSASGGFTVNARNNFAVELFARLEKRPKLPQTPPSQR
jgi:hypothetical protein